MRTVVISIVIFLIITTLGITQICIIKNYMSVLENNVENLEEAVLNEDPESLGREIKETQKTWKKMRFVLSLIINHEYIFEIDSALSELEIFSKSFDSAEASLSVSKAMAATLCITETSAFTIENII